MCRHLQERFDHQLAFVILGLFFSPHLGFLSCIAYILLTALTFICHSAVHEDSKDACVIYGTSAGIQVLQQATPMYRDRCISAESSNHLWRDTWLVLVQHQQLEG